LTASKKGETVELLPFRKLYSEARRGSVKDEKLLNELGAFYTSRALAEPGAFRAMKEAEGNFSYPGEVVEKEE
jgi:hypothetical protein